MSKHQILIAKAEKFKAGQQTLAFAKRINEASEGGMWISDEEIAGLMREQARDMVFGRFYKSVNRAIESGADLDAVLSEQLKFAQEEIASHAQNPLSRSTSAIYNLRMDLLMAAKAELAGRIGQSLEGRNF